MVKCEVSVKRVERLRRRRLFSRPRPVPLAHLAAALGAEPVACPLCVRRPVAEGLTTCRWCPAVPEPSTPTNPDAEEVTPRESDA